MVEPVGTAEKVDDYIEVFEGDIVSEEVLRQLWVDLHDIDHYETYGDPSLPGATTTAWFITGFDVPGNLVEVPHQPQGSLLAAKAAIDERFGIASNQVQVNWYKPRKGAPRHVDSNKGRTLVDPVVTLSVGAQRMVVADWRARGESRLDGFETVPHADEEHAYSRMMKNGDVMSLRRAYDIMHGVAPGLGTRFSVTFRQHH